MGKNQRHKKQLKAERAKTKLKGAKTKFLPKGQNVTDISFKIKPIVLPEQLRPSTSSEPLSTRKLTLKDILTRLNHHNTLIKVDNCQQLRELIESYPVGALRQSLAQILQGVCPLVLDVEHKIRKEAIRVLQCILCAISLKDVEAFFNVFSTYLRCSMTHIDPNVQEDSLQLLDVLLEHTPSLVASNVKQLLPNFFTLISKLRSDCKPGRALTQNLKSKHTSVRWRVKVLSGLKGIFEAMQVHEVGLSRENINFTVVKLNDCTPLYIDKYGNYQPSIDFFSDEISGGIAEEPIADHIKTLLPLLHETWTEVAPDLLSSSLGAVALKADASDTLTCILDVLYFCWRLAEDVDQKNNNSQIRQVFRSKTMKDLLDTLLKAFPYSQKIEQKRPTGGNQLNCLRENLLLCYIVCVTHKKVQMKSVINYVNYCLSNRNCIDNENVGLFVSLLKVVWRSNKDIMPNLLHFYQQYNKKLAMNNRLELLIMLCNALQDSENMNDKVFDLAKELPQLLLGTEVHTETLNFLLTLVKKDFATLREVLQRNLKAVLDNSLRINIVDAADPYLSVIQILSLYYYIPLSQDDLEVISQFGDDNLNYNNFVNYIINAQKL